MTKLINRMYDPYMGYGVSPTPLTLGNTNKKAPPGANAVDDFPDSHRYVHLLLFHSSLFSRRIKLTTRIEHAYRQSAPDSYGTGLGMMGGNMGGMGINNLPGSQMMLMGRGGGYPVG